MTTHLQSTGRYYGVRKVKEKFSTMDGNARIHLGPNILYLYDLNDMSNTGNPTQHQLQIQG